MEGKPNRVQDRISACWNMAAPYYDAQPGHGLQNEDERAAWLEMLKEVLPGSASDVLDVGTGTGFLAFRARELGHRTTGIDLSPQMLEYARRTAEGLDDPPRFLWGDAASPPFGPGTFGAVMGRHLLWTLREPERALGAWFELLRSGGRLLIVDILLGLVEADEERESDGRGEEFYTEEVIAELPLHGARSTEEVVSLIEGAGFAEVEPVDLSAIERAEGPLEETYGRYALRATRP